MRKNIICDERKKHLEKILRKVKKGCKPPKRIFNGDSGKDGDKTGKNKYRQRTSRIKVELRWAISMMKKTLRKDADSYKGRDGAPPPQGDAVTKSPEVHYSKELKKKK